ncbi:unnamed protein product, partial [Arabidopsis halleri]
MVIDRLRGAFVLGFTRLLPPSLIIDLKRWKQLFTGTMVSSERKIGLVLTGFGVLFSFLGIISVFTDCLEMFAMGN